MARLISTNPAKNYQKLGSVRVSTAKEIKQKVEAARKALPTWKELGAKKRVALLKPLFKEYFKRKKELALLVTREIGKPITESLDDMKWDRDYFVDFLQNGPKYLEDEVTYRKGRAVHRLVFEPIGVAAVIVPWNFPMANFLWGVVPNLIAGNTVVFKHSEECPLSGKMLDEMMAHLRLPKGVFSQVYGAGQVGQMLAEEEVDFIWFTGSSVVGKKLYEIAGKKFIKAIMELGGSNPAIIFDDIKIDEVADSLLWSRFSNCGQVCDCNKRFLIHKKIFDETVEKLKVKAEEIVVGDPENPKTKLGPLVAKRQLVLLKEQVADAVQKGATVITGGKEPRDLKGAYYLPTILTNVKPNMRVWRDEVFGPVLPMVAFETETEAVRLANDTVYGLGAKIFTMDKERGKRMASQIQAGCIDVGPGGNHWQVCTPFGGYKASGMGREHGRHGFQELTQIKVIAEG